MTKTSVAGFAVGVAWVGWGALFGHPVEVVAGGITGGLTALTWWKRRSSP